MEIIIARVRSRASKEAQWEWIGYKSKIINIIDESVYWESGILNKYTDAIKSAYQVIMDVRETDKPPVPSYIRIVI